MGKRILVIEEDTNFLCIIATALTEEGFEVISSTNSEPLNSLMEINPDIILLDHSLGCSLGQVICKELNEDPETEHIRVLLVSTARNPGETKTLGNSGKYITKPFDIYKLVGEVKNFLSS